MSLTRRLGQCEPTAGRITAIACVVAIGGIAVADAALGASGSDLPACPKGWEVEVVAQTPRLQHPTAVACSPDGRVFVCEDYMDMSGPVDRPVNRIVCVHPDGRITVFADQIYVAFSIEYIDGKLFVHHCPRFSVFADGGAIAAGRTDLIATTNPAPWGSSSRGQNQINDHSPAGFQLAMDGYLYIAVGDKGIHGFVGRDGRRLEMPLGGVVRMRPDGTHAEVYATGFRTVLNPAIDAQDEIFLYDNNDHLNIYKTAVGHIADGAYYGYPWDIRPPRPDYALPLDVRIYESGAPTGVLAYEEDGLPESYRGNLLLCDWGRGEVVRLALRRRGASYGVAAEEKLLAGNVRPTGIAVAPDGLSFYVGDWQFPGWRSDAKAGRLLRLTYRGASQAAPKPSWYVPAAMGRAFHASTDELVRGLSHPARSVRMVAQRRLAQVGNEAVPPLVKLLGDPDAPGFARWHAIWTLDAVDGGVSGRAAILNAIGDRDASIRAQALRQLGTRRAVEASGRLYSPLEDSDAVVRFQSATALGRMGAAGAVACLLRRLEVDDRLVRHAAITAMNRIGRAQGAAWTEIVEGLASDRPLVRDGTRLALRETYELPLVSALARFAARATLPGTVRSAAYLALFELHRMPAEWDGVWWRLGPLGFLEDARDAAARPPKTREWAGTRAVTGALHVALDDSETLVRRAAVESATLALDQGTIDRLLRLFDDPTAAEDRPALVAALGAAADPKASALVVAVLRRHLENDDVLLTAIAAARRQGGVAAKQALSSLVSIDRSPRLLAASLRAVGELELAESVPAVRARLVHPAVEVRAAAAVALGRIGGDQAKRALISALDDADVEVRQLAANALGSLRATSAVPALLEAWKRPETRSEALAALTRMPDARALEAYIDGLGSKSPGVRDECRKALSAIRDEVRSRVRDRLTAGSLPVPVVLELGTLYATDRELARLFAVRRDRREPADYAAFALANRGDPKHGRAIFDDPLGLGCIKCHRVNGAGGEGGPDLSRIASTCDRAELIESVLFPSKKVADGFRTTTLVLRDGRVVSGLVTSEADQRLVLIDGQGTKRDLPKTDIDMRTQSDTSPMPEGLQKGLTHEEFADLIAYLATLR
jgi:putative heme-binding domain-containing protein